MAHRKSSKESALVILAPEAEALVRSFRDQYDPSAAEGMPAHITVLYPFKPPYELTPSSLTALQSLFTRFSPFAFSLVELRRFPDVLYLAPTPEEPFKELTRVVVEHFPETPPYGGAFAEIIPHLTVAQLADQARLNDLGVEVGAIARAHLPVQVRTTEVALMDNAQGRWQVRAKLRLGQA
jgi:hypothetical protein